MLVEVVHVHMPLSAVCEHGAALFRCLFRISIYCGMRGDAVPFAVVFAVVSVFGQDLVKSRMGHHRFFSVKIGLVVRVYAGVLYNAASENG